ncbi:GxGYxYP putative glycoside hydrolase C-terminal domain [Pelomyxa schiedti]|nr:GxGYxYP putative glycoside hydrolase C-terminal domain [Pelomyxa schiedti]
MPVAAQRRQISAWCCFAVSVLWVCSCGAAVVSPIENSIWLSDSAITNIPIYGNMDMALVCDSDVSCLWWINWGYSTDLPYNCTAQLLFGVPSYKPVDNRVIPYNAWLSFEMKVNTTTTFYSSWGDVQRRSLLVEEQSTMRSSQGTVPFHVLHNITLISETTLVYNVTFSVRDTVTPYTYVLHPLPGEFVPNPAPPTSTPTMPPRKPVDLSVLDKMVPRKPEKFVQTNAMYWMQMVDDWYWYSALPDQAFTIGLQGLANRNIPQLYLVYGPNYDFKYTQELFSYYQKTRNMTFTFIETSKEALDIFIDSVKGYVIWDLNVRNSLTVAYTFAGLYDAVVVSEDMIPMVQNADLPLLLDLRGVFTGKSDVEIFQWAYDQYWAQTNKQHIVWLGGDCYPSVKPGVADWGVKNKMFFVDLSCRTTDTDEFTLASQMVSEMDSFPIGWGWHDYCKDMEREYVNLFSSYGGWIHGLNTLPDTSFINLIPLLNDWTFKNPVSDPFVFDKNMVYIVQKQTDGMGLGAWTDPTRGQIPCAWETQPDDYIYSPSLLEFWYANMTNNDYIMASLSGPGYMYPKKIPADDFHPLLNIALEWMEPLDMHAMSVMDSSEGSTVTGNLDLPKEIVDEYFSWMPNLLGFVNGYAAAYTFAVNDSIPFLSYEYYVDPDTPDDQVVADIQLLASVNVIRPYWMVIHVREFSSISRMEQIFDALGDGFQLLPFDTFMEGAGAYPTYETHYMDGLNGVSPFPV